MDKERQRELAVQGGKAVADKNRSFSRDPELAREAGRKGGLKGGGARNLQNKVRNDRIVLLRNQDKTISQITDIMSEQYPDLTSDAVNQVLFRHRKRLNNPT